MKLIVREHITAVAEPIKRVFNVTIDAVNNFGKIPMSIGEKKGDLIIFRGAGDPIRVPAGTVAGRILVTDPDSPYGWSIVPNSSSSGSSVTLHNATGVLVKGGTVVKIQSDYDFVKATSADTSMLFVTADDCNAGEDVTCYGVTNTICSVLCTTAAVAVNDQLQVSSTDGLAETTGSNGFAMALSAKAAGAVGAVEAIIVQNGFLPLSGGTLTGQLKIDTNQSIGIKLKKTDMVISENTNTNKFYSIDLLDNNDERVGILEIGHYANGNSSGIKIRTRRNVNGETIQNGIHFRINPDGKPVVAFDQKEAFLSALGFEYTSFKQLTNASAFTGSIYYKLHGDVCYVYGYNVKLASNHTGNSAVQLATLPSGYRPITGFSFMNAFGSSRLYGAISVATGGAISVYKDRGTATMTTDMPFYFQFSFPISN